MRQTPKHAEIFTACEDMIRQGRINLAREALERLNSARIPNELRLKFANLCRRIGLNAQGLKIIAGRLEHSPSEAERAEYATLLQRIGCIDQSWRILQSISAEKLPVVNLYLAFNLFNRWEYAGAVPFLEKFIQSASTPYDRLLGEVNLAAAFVASGRYEEARPLLCKVIGRAKENGSGRLLANALEIQTQAFHFLRENENAAESLRAARKILAHGAASDQASLDKWEAVLTAARTGSTEGLRKFREEAALTGNWEAFRNIDQHFLRFEFIEELFQFHLFGSMWIAYRDQTQRLLGKVISLDEYVWGDRNGTVIDIRGDIGSSEKIHRTLEALSRDFYRPLPAGELFTLLFPGEHFDPFSSANRVHQAVFKLRHWFAEQKYPVKVNQLGDSYKLELPPNFGLLLPYERRSPDQNQWRLGDLRENFAPAECFTLKQLASSLNIKLPAARKFAAWAIEQGHFQRTGAGTATLYELVVPGRRGAA
jgi:hypothetical protein